MRQGRAVVSMRRVPARGLVGGLAILAMAGFIGAAWVPAGHVLAENGVIHSDSTASPLDNGVIHMA